MELLRKGERVMSQYSEFKSEDEARQSANQDFLRSLSQLEQTLMAEADLTELALPSLTPIALPDRPNLTEPSAPISDESPNTCQAVLNHLDIEEMSVALADVEHFMEEEGIPLDSPLASYIRNVAAETPQSGPSSGPSSGPNAAAVAAESHTK
jgi:hypothetical protein